MFHACSTGLVHRVVCLRFAKQFLRFALVRVRGIVLRHLFNSIDDESPEKDFRDSAVVPSE